MNNYDKLAKISDIKGAEAVSNFLTDLGFKDDEFKIEPSEDKYSPFDLMLFIGGDMEIIPIEIKYRKKKYNTLMMEHAKAQRLTAIKGTDHWYVNVFVSGEEPVIFSLNKLRKCNKEIINKEINMSETNINGNYIKLASIRSPSNTAYSGDKILKRCWFIPNSLRINN